MTEYQFKKREAEFEKEHEHDFKETSDADYLHEKIYFYYQICKELLKENKKLKKFENRCKDLEERLHFKERVLDKILCGMVFDAQEEVEREDQEQK